MAFNDVRIQASQKNLLQLPRSQLDIFQKKGVNEDSEFADKFLEDLDFDKIVTGQGVLPEELKVTEEKEEPV